MNLRTDDPLAVTVLEAIHKGDAECLQRLLSENPGLATARLGIPVDGPGMARSLLHLATDWPGHFPNVATTIAILIAAGADVNARFTGSHTETPLHWAASSGDLAALDALLDGGADIEAPGAVIAGGTALDDAVAFGQWGAAQRLVERGAQLALWHAAALGLMNQIEGHFAGRTLSARYPWGAKSPQPPHELNVAFWCACHGGQRRPAEYLLARGADLNWISGWDGLTPLDVARRHAHAARSAADSSHRDAEELVSWLRARGAKSAQELK